MATPADIVREASAHPTKVRESENLTLVEKPAMWYSPCCSLRGISQVQMEAVILACQQHERIVDEHTRARAGFYLGDGTGVGKGRTLAAILHERWHRTNGAMRALWVSISPTLYADATDDLSSVTSSSGAQGEGPPAPTPPIKMLQGKVLLSQEWNGVVFCSYAMLAGEQRLAQLKTWLARDKQCVMLFDEAHRARHLGSGAHGGGSKGSKAAQHVLQLQQEFPGARVVYSSATGAMRVTDMLYMERLWLWGCRGAPFAQALDFSRTLMAAGIGAQEMLALELRARGQYIARALDFSDADFSIIEALPSGAQRRTYDQCAAAWRMMAKEQDTTYWLRHQRFFKTLITAFKVEAAISCAEHHLQEGKSVVFALQTTGEASSRRGCLDSGLMQALQQMRLRYHDRNPTAAVPDLTSLQLPMNPLDQLLWHFGHDRVAEITGRKFQVLPGKHVRAKPSNQRERQAFMDGAKDIAIISEAGSSGISLHASARAQNQKRRVQIMLEFPWSSSAFVQQCGRVHRTDQKSAPEIVVVTTTIPGEKRFSANMYQRLQTMGALTRGDRYSAHGGMRTMAEHFDYGNARTREALRYVARELWLHRIARWRDQVERAMGCSCLDWLQRQRGRYSDYVYLTLGQARKGLGLNTRTRNVRHHRGIPISSCQEALVRMLCHQHHAELPIPHLGQGTSWDEAVVLGRAHARSLLYIGPQHTAYQAGFYDVRELPYPLLLYHEEGHGVRVHTPPGIQPPSWPWVEKHLVSGGGPLHVDHAIMRWHYCGFLVHALACFQRLGGELPTRTWSPELWRTYPLQFRNAVHTVLATHNRPGNDLHGLPHHLVHDIVARLTHWHDLAEDALPYFLQMQGKVSDVTSMQMDTVFNRMMGWPLAIQEAFMQRLNDRMMEEPPPQGHLEERVVQAFHVHERYSPAEGVHFTTLRVHPLDRRISWEQLRTMRQPRVWRQKRSKRLVALVQDETAGSGVLWRITNRHTPQRAGPYQDLEAFVQKHFTEVPTKDQESTWCAQHDQLQAGTQSVILLTGLLLPWWSRLHEAVQHMRRSHQTTLQLHTLRLRQVHCTKGMIGLHVPPTLQPVLHQVFG